MSPPPPGLVGKTSLLQQLDYLGEITIFYPLHFTKYSWTYPGTWYLVQGTFLLPNGSISNITGWKLVDPTSGEIPHLLWCQQIRKSCKWGQQIQEHCFFWNKKPPAGQNRDSEDWRTEFVFTEVQNIYKSIQTYPKPSKSIQTPNRFGKKYKIFKCRGNNYMQS